MNKCVLLLSVIILGNTLNALSVICIGDSIVAPGPVSQPDQVGWGETLPDFFTEEVAVINHAIGGRSSKSFVDEGRWDSAKEDIREGDFVLIEFGHNDQKNDPTRFTNPETTFRDYLRLYISDSRELGAIPVLVTPLARRIFGSDGKASQSLAPYARAMEAVADERDVMLIDMHSISIDYYNFLGEAESLQYGDVSTEGVLDRVHFNRLGAVWCARWITSLILWSEHQSSTSLASHINWEIPNWKYNIPTSASVQIELSQDMRTWKGWGEPFAPRNGTVRLTAWVEHRNSVFARIVYTMDE